MKIGDIFKRIMSHVGSKPTLKMNFNPLALPSRPRCYYTRHFLMCATPILCHMHLRLPHLGQYLHARFSRVTECYIFIKRISRGPERYQLCGELTTPWWSSSCLYTVYNSDMLIGVIIRANSLTFSTIWCA